MSAQPAAAVEHALPRACALCPWRLGNAGKPTEHGFYTAANLRRLWTGLRTGRAPGMTCHGTDPRGHGADDAGAEATHECMGAIVLLVREVMRFQAITFAVEAEKAASATLRRDEGLRRYRQEAGPNGMSRDGLAAAVWRMVMGDSPISRHMGSTADAVNDPDVGYARLPVWDPTILERSRR